MHLYRIAVSPNDFLNALIGKKSLSFKKKNKDMKYRKLKIVFYVLLNKVKKKLVFHIYDIQFFFSYLTRRHYVLIYFYMFLFLKNVTLNKKQK